MIECIAIINQKGGVGKSTTSNAVGAGLYHKGYKVLYIDLDAQGNLSYSVGIASNANSSLEVLTGTATVKEATVHTSQGDLIPASPSLSGADTIITEIGKEYRLKEAINFVQSDYDYIIIDTPPSLGILTVNALTACDSVIIPAQADIYSLQGIGQLHQTMQIVKRYCNKDLKIKGILITRYNSRAILSRDMSDMLQETAKQLNTKLYDTKIRECIALKESQARQKDIFTYSPKSNASADYADLVEEIIKGGNNND